MRSKNARFDLRMPYRNSRYVEGTSIGFSYFCEWFEVNVHDAKSLAPEAALTLIEASPNTRLDSSATDNYGNVRWFGGSWVRRHHVRVWYNPKAI